MHTISAIQSEICLARQLMMYYEGLVLRKQKLIAELMEARTVQEERTENVCEIEEEALSRSPSATIMRRIHGVPVSEVLAKLLPQLERDVEFCYTDLQKRMINTAPDMAGKIKRGMPHVLQTAVNHGLLKKVRHGIYSLNGNH